MLKATEPDAAPAASWAEIFANIDERRLLLERLTPLERTIVGHIRQGRGNREIAARLKKTEPTIKRHVSLCYKKLGVASRVRLIALLR